MVTLFPTLSCRPAMVIQALNPMTCQMLAPRCPRENMKLRHTSPSTHIPEKLRQPRRAEDFSVSENAAVFIWKWRRVFVRTEGKKSPFYKNSQSVKLCLQSPLFSIISPLKIQYLFIPNKHCLLRKGETEGLVFSPHKSCFEQPLSSSSPIKQPARRAPFIS